MFVTGGNAPEVLDLEEEPFDEIALAIEDIIAGDLGDVFLGGITGMAPWLWMVSRNALES